MDDFLLKPGPKPLHEQVTEHLSEMIVSGAWPPHYKLAAEPELAQTFGISRGTVRRAFKSLIASGVLVQVQGKGTFVASASSVEQPVAQELLSFDEGLRRLGVPFVTEVRDQQVTAPPAEVAGLLSLPPETPVLRVLRRRKINDTWSMLILSYVRRDLCPEIEDQDFTRASLFEVLEDRYGHELDWARRTFEAKLADAAVARELEVAEESPVLYLEQVSYLVDSRPIEYSDVWIRGDKVKLSSLLKRGRVPHTELDGATHVGREPSRLNANLVSRRVGAAELAGFLTFQPTRVTSTEGSS